MYNTEISNNQSARATKLHISIINTIMPKDNATAMLNQQNMPKQLTFVDEKIS